ncbi:MAG: tetratricopeptide repeat protein [Deltaproteobacteria bacterium]|nr:tetratricopeptide repeat protein [Deltaproteobacteria bacterium]
MDMRFKFVVCAFLLLVLQPYSLRAADDDARVQKIREHYFAGVSLREKGQYAEAAKEFRALVALSPRYEYYFEIGECEYLRNRYDLAFEAFTTFRNGAGKNGDPRSMAFSKKALKESSKHIGYLNSNENKELEIWVDGEQRGITPLAKPIVILTGKHQVVFKLDGASKYKTNIDVPVGETVLVAYVAPAPKAESTPEAVQKQPEKKLTPAEIPVKSQDTKSIPRRHATLKTAGIITASVGGAVIAAGIVTGIWAQHKDNKLDERCDKRYPSCPQKYQNLADSGQNLAVTTDVLLPLGGAIMATGAVLAIVGYRRSKKKYEQLSFQLIQPTRDLGMSLMLNGRF